ncbi:MAG: alpha/beta hydrolase [Phycisphaerae bacterium]
MMAIRGWVMAVAMGFAVVGSGAGLMGQTATTRPAQTPVLSANTELHADVAYGGPDGRLDVLDVYSPKGVTGAPVVVFGHGGAWSRGDKRDVSFKPKFLNEEGVVFVAVNYRLSPKDVHPAQVQDVATAIGWVHQHIGEYGGDPGKIVIMGHSAGCHLVTLVTLDPEFLAKVGMKPGDLRGVVAWSGGMYDLPTRVKGGGMYPPFIQATFGETAAAQWAGSPLAYVSNAKGAPRFLIASCDDEHSKTSRAASQQMIDAINAHGGKAEGAVLAGKVHFTANYELGMAGDKTGGILMGFVREVTE